MVGSDKRVTYIKGAAGLKYLIAGSYFEMWTTLCQKF